MPPEYILRAVDFGAESFRNGWKKLSPEIQKEARKFIGEMTLCERMPAKLHFHKLEGFDGIWTIHVTSNDKYKASFTIKDGVAYMRRIGPHDWIDKSPE